MQVVQALSEVSPKFLYSRLWKFLVLLNQLEQISASAVLENNPQMIPSFVPVVKLQNVAILQVVKDSNLEHKQSCLRQSTNHNTYLVEDLASPEFLYRLYCHVFYALLLAALIPTKMVKKNNTKL